MVKIMKGELQVDLDTSATSANAWFAVRLPRVSQYILHFPSSVEPG